MSKAKTVAMDNEAWDEVLAQNPGDGVVRALYLCTRDVVGQLCDLERKIEGIEEMLSDHLGKECEGRK